MSISYATKGLFITGTDTGVGKTYVAAHLIRALCDRGIEVIPRKPVESGCMRNQSGILEPNDGRALLVAAGVTDLEAVTPYRFSAPLAPPRAAALAGQTLSLEQLIDACQAGSGLRVIEGAGGFLSPIAENALNADLALALGLPVIVIVADRLGCINHCLLTCEAIERRGLEIMAVIINQASPTDSVRAMDNVGELRERLPCPVFDISHLAGPEAFDGIAALILSDISPSNTGISGRQ